MEQIQNPPRIDPDKFQRAVDLVHEWKVAKRKGKIILHFNGSGRVSKIEKSEYIS